MSCYLPSLMTNGFVCHMQEDSKLRASASLSRALKDALLSVLRCRAPQALTWHNKVCLLLKMAPPYLDP